MRKAEKEIEIVSVRKRLERLELVVNWNGNKRLKKKKIEAKKNWKDWLGYAIFAEVELNWKYLVIKRM